MRSAPTALVLNHLRRASYSALELLDRIVKESSDGVIRELARDAAGPLRMAVSLETTDEFRAAYDDQKIAGWQEEGHERPLSAYPELPAESLSSEIAKDVADSLNRALETAKRQTEAQP